jgi:hypothetical protein
MIEESIVNSLSVKHQNNVAFTSVGKDQNQEGRLITNPHLVVASDIPFKEWKSLTPTVAMTPDEDGNINVEKVTVKLIADITTGNNGNENAFYTENGESNFLVIPNHALWKIVIYEDNGTGLAPDLSKEVIDGKGNRWDFNPASGILWSENGDILDIYIKPLWVVGYRYIGQTMSIHGHGPGTINFITKFLDLNGTNIGDSQLFDNGTNVGIGTVSPLGKLDVSYGGISLVLGADADAITRTDSTSKIARIGAAHYTNIEDPTCITYCNNTSTENILSIGGGTTYLNAATNIKFYTAANNITATGNLIMEILSNGNIAINTHSLSYDGAVEKGLKFTDTNVAYIQNTPMTSGTINYSLSLQDDTAYAAGVGAGIAFFGKYNADGWYASFGGIKAIKANATDGNYSSQMHFQTRLSGSPATTKMIIDENGKVSVIGYTTDIEMLRLSSSGEGGSTQGKTYIGIDHFNDSTYPSVRIGAEENGVASHMASIVFQTRDANTDSLPTTKMSILSNGNIAINTHFLSYDGVADKGLYFVGSSSQARLINTVGTAGDCRYNLSLQDDTAMAAGVGAGIDFEGHDGVTDNRTFAGIKGIKANATSGNYSGQLHFQTRLNGSTPGTRMIIDESGKVGIGTTSPSGILDVRTGSESALSSYAIIKTSGDTAYQGGLLISNSIGTGAQDTSFKISSSFNSGTSATLQIGIVLNSDPTTYLNTNPHIQLSRNGTVKLAGGDGNVGIGTGSPKGKLDVCYGGISMVLGADDGAITRTNSTEKRASIATVHYTNAEEPQAFAYIQNNAASSVIHIGGGVNTLNAVTSIKFLTAANNTTLTGTERMAILSDGSVTVGNPTGGGKGAGTLNAVALYDDGTIVSGYVLDMYNNLFYDINKWNKSQVSGIHLPARQFLDIADIAFDLDKYNKYILNNKYLPTFAEVETSGNILSTGAMIQKLWEVAEISAIHIAQLTEEIKVLKSKIMD